MKTIPLTQNQFTLVDDEDYDYLNQFKWYTLKCKKSNYAVRDIWLNKKKKTIIMHRIILNASKGFEVDHIDHNGLNNQKHNIRICTHAQNAMNSRLRHSKSNYKGVSYVDKYIMACLQYSNKRYYLGYFKSEIEAAYAYDKKAKELFGEYANLNFK